MISFFAAAWQVTGIRHDAYANANRIPVVEDKPKNERGTYISPKAHGQPESKQLDYITHQKIEQQLRNQNRDN